MKAISIKQPWAWLIANGYMTVENRKWYTGHRGDLLIHAGKSETDVDLDIEFVRKKFRIGIERDQLEFGKAIAVADLIACSKEPKAAVDKYWHVDGCFAWSLRRIRPIEPFEIRGKLNLFDVPFSWDEYPEQIAEPVPMGRALLVAGYINFVQALSGEDEPAYLRRKKS
jgi:hypothetical protein